MEPNETAEVTTEETSDVVDTGETSESTTEEAATTPPKVEKPKRTPEEELEHLLGRVKRLQKDLGKAVESTKEDPKPTSGKLDETALDFLDLKGINEQEDIDVIRKVMEKTGQTPRQALKDDYVLSKLKANKEARDVKSATPSSTKRSGGGETNTFDLDLANYEQKGVLPDDFKRKAAVINYKIEKENTNKPAWH